MASRQLLGRDIPAPERERLSSKRPTPIIRRGEIDCRPLVLSRIAEHVQIPGAGWAHRAHYCDHATFRRRMENEFVRLGLNFAETVHAAHVMDTVHGLTSSGFF